MSVVAHQTDEELPAWSLSASAGDSIHLPSVWPERVTREWAFGDATGAGVRVCVLDSGIELDHPLVGEVQRSVAVVKEGNEIDVVDDDQGDLCGHGTACAGIIRSPAGPIAMNRASRASSTVGRSDAGSAWANARFTCIAWKGL